MVLLAFCCIQTLVYWHPHAVRRCVASQAGCEYETECTRQEASKLLSLIRMNTFLGPQIVCDSDYSSEKTRGKRRPPVSRSDQTGTNTRKITQRER
ncbi:hypothetical protein BDV95DRAFT_106952 [Massariosphaeria phaeospora]|uniref:Secreted protein n=1 Tax=Massariosphaeria phaeospora TaxID=100035 RepID=A0A7C8I2A0_9PLEO|nr:hypothetical protein BDV95DRAFT_106952 [Massariosphaeria phaeospora]